MKILRFTEKDYQSLILLLGLAAGAYSKDNSPVPEGFREVIDWTLIQGGPNNYTYWHDKNRLSELKEKELIGDSESTKETQ